MGFGKRHAPGGQILGGQKSGGESRSPMLMEAPRATAGGTIATPSSMDPTERNRWLVVILMIVPGFFAVESLLSGTSLITPVSTAFLWTLRGIGLVVGIALMALLWNTANFQANSAPRQWLTALLFPFIMGFAFGEVGWRMADWWEFAGSGAHWEVASYPIADVHHGRRSAYDSIEIDPFAVGDKTDIPVSRDQYAELLTTYSGQCIQVSQRHSASGAIEIRTDGRHNLTAPAMAIVGSC